jgi:hypothetical protein
MFSSGQPPAHTVSIRPPGKQTKMKQLKPGTHIHVHNVMLYLGLHLLGNISSCTKMQEIHALKNSFFQLSVCKI